MPTRPTVRITPVDPATWPPVPDRAVVDAFLARHRAQRDADPGPVPPEVGAGHYIGVILDVRTGELRAHAHDWRVRGHDYDPAVTPMTPNGGPHQFFKVPAQMRWSVDSGVEEFPHLDAAAATGLLEAIAPIAQTLIDNLVAVPDTERWDWSAAAASAAYDITRRCSRRQLPPQGRWGQFIDCADAIAAVPGLLRPEYADATDARLDDAAESISRYAVSWHPQLRALSGLPDSAGPWVGVVGAYAFLYRYRAEQAQDRTPLDATAWFARPGRSLVDRVGPDVDDAGLARFAEAEQTAATLDRVKLVGTLDVLRAHRTALRRRLVDELDGYGAAVKAAEEALAFARATRAGRLAQIIGWNDPAFDNDAELARRAHMTRQAMSKFRSQFDAGDEAGTDDAGGVLVAQNR